MASFFLVDMLNCHKNGNGTMVMAMSLIKLVRAAYEKNSCHQDQQSKRYSASGGVSAYMVIGYAVLGA